jgi:hypothetical protein
MPCSQLSSLGQLESTFMHSSVREANLQALLSDNSELRSRVGDLTEVYEAILAEDVRGTCLAHMVDAVHLTEPGPDFIYDRKRLRGLTLPDEIIASLVHFLKGEHIGAMDSQASDGRPDGTISPKVDSLDKFSLRGVEYATRTCRSRNSHVLFQARSAAHPEAAQITCIFFNFQVPSHSMLASVQQGYPPVYICVQPYVPLQTGSEFNNMDQMYRRFGSSGGFLCQREVGPPVIIRPSSIISHVAITPLQIGVHQMLHILPMDRVRVTF